MHDCYNYVQLNTLTNTQTLKKTTAAREDRQLKQTNGSINISLTRASYWQVLLATPYGTAHGDSW